MIKVSVVVPVYNVEKYLRKCLTSLANQTLQEMEVIVVNDGTKDRSQDIIDEFVAAYPNKFRSFIKENGGLSDARNYGMPYCRGEYIGFVDSDDYVDADMYEAMYNEAKRIDADMVMCDYLKEYPNNKVCMHARKYNVPEEMFFGGLAAAWNKLYRRELVEKTGTLFPKGLIYEDTEFYCKLIPHITSCGYVDKPFVHYVQREGSIANTSSRKVAMIFDIFDDIYHYYQTTGFIDKYSQELEYFMIHVLLGSSMERICKCADRQIRKELLQKTVLFLQEKNKNWKKNKYLSVRKGVRNMYIKSVGKHTIYIISNLLRFWYTRRDRKIYS